MKFILLFGESDELVLELTKLFESRGFTCARSFAADEVRQAGKHMKKIAVVFLDSRFAYKFILNNNFYEFEWMRVLFVPKTPLITEDVQRKLSRVSLSLYYPKIQNQMLKDIEKFFSDNRENETRLDIQFFKPDLEEE